MLTAGVGTLQTIAIKGEPAPDGNGNFGSLTSSPAFGQPAFNDRGEMAISSLALEGRDAVVRVSSESGRNYQLQRRRAAGAGVWEGEGEVVAGTGAELELRHPDAVTNFDQQFYQVEVAEP
jgi:hypothetical protein